jgi:hypothetical protein
MKFDAIDDLVARIKRDIVETRARLANVDHAGNS